jgi:hypothetical protein
LNVLSKEHETNRLKEVQQSKKLDLKQDTVDEAQFTEEGTLSKHTPLEILDFCQ